MTKTLDVLTVQKDMISKFQCVGCDHFGPAEHCTKFQLNSEWGFFYCSNHNPLSFASIKCGSVCLGLPKGFNRLGALDFNLIETFIRLWISPDSKTHQSERPHFDKFNIPTWAMEYKVKKVKGDSYLFVRTYSPRTNQTFVDVIKGCTIDQLRDYCDDGVENGIIDVSKFHDEID